LADDPEIKMDPEGLVLRVEGIDWVYHEQAYIAFNKPANYECSHKTKHHPSVYSLLPRPLIERAVQCVGRLDQDTTGLLLLSDDGQFIHRMTTPKKNIGKVYEITDSRANYPKANRPFTEWRCTWMMIPALASPKPAVSVGRKAPRNDDCGRALPSG
jgi:16S rRNA U516 pseudouridylate synthase RsuA-like enzyme